MKNYFRAIVGAIQSAIPLGIAVALGIAPAAGATQPADIGISFDLAPSSSSTASELTFAAQPIDSQSDVIETKPLHVPDRAATIPTGASKRASTVAELPPPPVVMPSKDSPTAGEIVIAEGAIAPKVSPDSENPKRSPASSLQTREDLPEAAALPVAELKFEAAELEATETPKATAIEQTAPEPIPSPIAIAPAQPSPSDRPSAELEALFEGDENSLVARAVGSAEGTRTSEGDRTWAYRGHTDPGNGVWNLGSFSYQHGADSPEAADRKQLQRLMGQANTLRQAAKAQGIDLTLEAELNGIDLANQSPRAALSRGGYIDRLRQAYDMGLQGSDAVLWARTRAFLDPDTSRWNAPGLGNNVDSITADQERRRRAIARAISTPLKIAATNPAEESTQQAMAAPTPRREDSADQESIANQIISLDLPPT
jgi:hypothetical protein